MASFMLCEQVVEKRLTVALEEKRQTRACIGVVDDKKRCIQNLLEPLTLQGAYIIDVYMIYKRFALFP